MFLSCVSICTQHKEKCIEIILSVVNDYEKMHDNDI